MMVKFSEHVFSYDYSFPAVTLAYFLRYPNPYSTHVLATDVIDRHFDPQTQRLHTTRLHLKRGKLPSAIAKLLPSSLLGTARKSNGDVRETYVLERSTVDMKTGVMTAESRNLDWTGVLSIVERQRFSRPRLNDGPRTTWDDRSTDVVSSVTLVSRLGQSRFKKAWNKKTDLVQQSDEPKQGILASLSSAGLQRSVELVGLRKTADQLRESREGMRVVLERMRTGGMGAVLEGMRHDRIAGLEG
ncbi:MAG: hypothetical protein M1814_005311 [Vezdaea aestivalis]|nr:MAG: hypothetical protein M1814_005311 [Vezdaea aestivalis]